MTNINSEQEPVTTRENNWQQWLTIFGRNSYQLARLLLGQGSSANDSQTATKQETQGITDADGNNTTLSVEEILANNPTAHIEYLARVIQANIPGAYGSGEGRKSDPKKGSPFFFQDALYRQMLEDELRK